MRLRTSITFLITSVALQAQPKYPATEKREVSDNYFGTVVKDPYRWLEDDRDPKVEAWVKKQNEVTTAYFSPLRQALKVKTRLTELWDYNRESAPFRKGDRYFCYRNNGLQNQGTLFVLNKPGEKGEVLLDPNVLSQDGTVSLNGLSVSNDGNTLAYGISRAGSDWVEIHFKDITSKAELPDIIKWVKFSGMSWRGKGIYYSRYNEPQKSALTEKNRFHKVYYHALGTDQEKDVLLYEDKDHPDYNFGAQVTEDERYLFLYASRSTSGEMLMMKDLASAKPGWITLADNFENDYSVIENFGDRFYVLTNYNAPNYRLVSFTAGAPAKDKWLDVVPANEHRLESVHFTANGMLASYLENAQSTLYAFDKEGKGKTKVLLPGICRVTAINTRKEDTLVSLGVAKFTAPEATFMLNSKTLQTKELFKPACSFKSDDYVTSQVFFNSKDGTRIPMFITHKKDLAISRETPCFVYGYGGFNISLAPEFRIDRAVFLEAGGIYCVPNLRGGGEFGEDWHKAGTKCRKQNVFDDFIAACEWLVTNKYTSYQRIAIHGRSNGGLLVGAVMTQRPDICRVAVPTVGVLDMLRYHQFTIGRAWATDYGSSENEEEFKCLKAYSPLHNLKNAAYPATLIMTGDHDDRVVPAHSFKFAATLQEMNAGNHPALIRIDVNAGHGAGKPTTKLIQEFADMWGFVFNELKIEL
jgi:prolyl oligopeptidase